MKSVFKLITYDSTTTFYIPGTIYMANRSLLWDLRNRSACKHQVKIKCCTSFVRNGKTYTSILQISEKTTDLKLASQSTYESHQVVRSNT